jgi:sec-independent protein translocase protein TatA
MLNNLTGWHFLVILVVILLLFGAPKLPGLARSLGQSMKIFKNEIKPDKTEGETLADDPTRPATDGTTRATGTSQSTGSTDSSSTKP